MREQSSLSRQQMVREKNKRLGFILLSVVLCFFIGIVIKEIVLEKHVKQALLTLVDSKVV